MCGYVHITLIPLPVKPFGIGAVSPAMQILE